MCWDGYTGLIILQNVHNDCETTSSVPKIGTQQQLCPATWSLCGLTLGCMVWAAVESNVSASGSIPENRRGCWPTPASMCECHYIHTYLLLFPSVFFVLIVYYNYSHVKLYTLRIVLIDSGSYYVGITMQTTFIATYQYGVLLFSPNRSHGKKPEEQSQSRCVCVCTWNSSQ